MTTPISAVDSATTTSSIQSVRHHHHDPAASDAGAGKIASAAGTPPPKAHGHHGGGHHGAKAESKGENSGLREGDKLDQVSQLLDMSTDDVSGRATSASGLVNLFQSKGVDLSSLKNVLDNGDLLDVAA